MVVIRMVRVDLMVRSLLFFKTILYFCILNHSQLYSPSTNILQINAFVTIVQMETQRGLDMIAR